MVDTIDMRAGGGAVSVKRAASILMNPGKQNNAGVVKNIGRATTLRGDAMAECMERVVAILTEKVRGAPLMQMPEGAKTPMQQSRMHSFRPHGWGG